MILFWVIGGQYTQTRFQEPVGGNEEWYGPFANYEAARREWSRHAWPGVDQRPAHYRIARIDPDAPPPCTD